MRWYTPTATYDSRRIDSGHRDFTFDFRINSCGPYNADYIQPSFARHSPTRLASLA